MSKKGRKPNDYRSDTLNPNNLSYKSKIDNRANQLNPNNPVCYSSLLEGGNR